MNFWTKNEDFEQCAKLCVLRIKEGEKYCEKIMTEDDINPMMKFVPAIFGRCDVMMSHFLHCISIFTVC